MRLLHDEVASAVDDFFTTTRVVDTELVGLGEVVFETLKVTLEKKTASCFEKAFANGDRANGRRVVGILLGFADTDEETVGQKSASNVTCRESIVDDVVGHGGDALGGKSAVMT